MIGKNLYSNTGEVYKVIKAIAAEDRPNANIYLCKDRKGSEFVAKHFYNGNAVANIGFNKYNHYGRRRDGSQTVFSEIQAKSREYDFLVKHIDRIWFNRRWVIIQEYVKGDLLSHYIEANKNNFEKLHEITTELAKTLNKWHSYNFAHGDGHLDNAIVRFNTNGKPEIILIDYSLIHHPDFEYCKRIGCFDSGRYDRVKEDLENVSNKLGNGFLDGLKRTERDLNLGTILSDSFNLTYFNSRQKSN